RRACASDNPCDTGSCETATGICRFRRLGPATATIQINPSGTDVDPLNSRFGQSVALLNFGSHGDGTHDIAIGAPEGAGRVGTGFLVFGPIAAGQTITVPDALYSTTFDPYNITTWPKANGWVSRGIDYDSGPNGNFFYGDVANAGNLGGYDQTTNHSL